MKPLRVFAFRLGALALVAGLVPGPAAAQMWERCSDLWFTLGQLLDRAGFCFPDDRRAGVFDNSDCTPGAPQLDDPLRRAVELARANAAALGCDIEIGSSFLPLTRFDLRDKLELIPVPATHSRGCLLWRGDPIYLYAGPRLDAEVTGAVGYNDDIFWEYETPGAPEGWSFLTVYVDGAQIALGWTDMPLDETRCGGFYE